MQLFFFYNSVYNVMTLLQPALSAFYIQNIVITRRTRVDSCTHAVRQCVRLQLITPLNCRPPGCTLPDVFVVFSAITAHSSEKISQHLAGHERITIMWHQDGLFGQERNSAPEKILSAKDVEMRFRA